MYCSPPQRKNRLKNAVFSKVCQHFPSKFFLGGAAPQIPLHAARCAQFFGLKHVQRATKAPDTLNHRTTEFQSSFPTLDRPRHLSRSPGYYVCAGALAQQATPIRYLGIKEAPASSCAALPLRKASHKNRKAKALSAHSRPLKSSNAPGARLTKHHEHTPPTNTTNKTRARAPSLTTTHTTNKRKLAEPRRIAPPPKTPQQPRPRATARRPAAVRRARAIVHWIHISVIFRACARGSALRRWRLCLQPSLSPHRDEFLCALRPATDGRKRTRIPARGGAFRRPLARFMRLGRAGTSFAAAFEGGFGWRESVL